ncbi:MAG: hypothetical protein V1907_02770 [Candidatus Kerfeldbacteria bacterium]
MKKVVGTILSVVVGLCAYTTVEASIVMSTDISAPGGLTPSTFSELKGTTFTDLNMSMMDFTSNLVFKRGNALIYTSSEGIVKQTIGASTVSVLKKASSVYLVNTRGPQLVISNNATTKNTGSYIYNVDAKKSKLFTLKVTDVIQARFSPNGKWVALLGKNAKGKSRLFVSTTSIEKLREYQLPKGTTKCVSMAISPDSATLALVCEKKYENGSASNGITLRKFSANVLEKEQQYMDTSFTIYDIVWKDKSTIVGLGFGPAATGSGSGRIPFSSLSVKALENSPFAIGLHKYTVKNGKVSKSTAYPFITSDIVDPSNYIVPMQLFLSSKNVVDYSALNFTATDGEAGEVSSYLSRYNLSTQQQSVLLKNEKVNFFSEYQLVSS